MPPDPLARTESPGSSIFPRRPSYMHPQISRLRSPSGQALLRLSQGHRNASPSSSAFDISRHSSISNLHELGMSRSPSDLVVSDIPETPTQALQDGSPLRWTPLRRISAKVYASGNRSQALGQPTVLAASGLVCIGTQKGWVMVYDYSQTLKCVCGTEAIGSFCSASIRRVASINQFFLVPICS
jgi:hypothetical protein